MKRPTGVTILAVIATIYGIFSLLLTFLAVVGLRLAAAGVGHVASQYTVRMLVYAAISDGVLGVLYLAFGIGAFSLKRWGWITGVVVLVLDVVRSIATFVIQGFNARSIVVPIITIVIALVLLWYLFRPNVRAAFGFAKAA